MGVKYFRDVVVGGMSRYDIWSAGRNMDIQFVDGDYGNGNANPGGNAGFSPRSAVVLPSAALTNITTRGGVIYVRPRTTAASAQTYYVDNITIPITKPGMSIIGCSNGSPNSYNGVQLKPSTVTAHLIEVNGAGLLLEGMRLTLTGGTADLNKSIVHAVNTASNKPSGMTIRGCWFANDKSHPGITGDDAIAAVALACEEAVVEDCTFFNCLGGIAIQSVLGSSRKIYIRRNYFSGDVLNRDCDLIISINAATCSSIIVHGNVFSDGLPNHSGGGTKRFIYFPYVTAGVGCLAGNFFATSTNQIVDETGSECIIGDTFHCPGNFYEGTGTTAPYGIATIV